MTATASAHDTAAFDRWFETFVPNESNATVLCFPYSGSGASMFGPWRKLIHPRVRLAALRLPGRESLLNQPPRDHLLSTADEIAGVIAADRTVDGAADGRLFLVGFSLGGLMAFEVARGLRQRDVRIDLLVAASCRAPQGRLGRGSLHKLSDDRFLKQLHKQYGAVPDAVWNNDELKRLLLPMLRADIKMFETYEYRDQPPLDCELLALAGRRDRQVKAKHVAAWREQASSFRHRSFDADHYLTRTHASAVVETINRRIDRLLP